MLLVLGVRPLGNTAGLAATGAAADVAIAIVVLIDVVLAVICLLKGKLWTGFFAVFIPAVGLVGASRIARPGSPWARRRYRDRPKKLTKAQRREDHVNATWRTWRTALFDLIAGKPHLPSVTAGADGASSGGEAEAGLGPDAEEEGE